MVCVRIRQCDGNGNDRRRLKRRVVDPDLDSHGYAFIPPGSGSEEKLEDKNRKKARTLVEIEILFLKVK